MKIATANPRRRFALAALLGFVATPFIIPQASAQAFPDKSIRLIVPFPAGGPTDIVARPLGQCSPTP